MNVFTTLGLGLWLLLITLPAAAQAPAAPAAAPQAAKTDKAPIAMAGKHEISFNLRDFDFSNNSILGLAYRYHWNAKWNLRVQADVGLSYNLRLGEFVGPDSSLQRGFGNRAANIYSYAFLLGSERKIAVGPGDLLIGANLGIGVQGQDEIRYVPIGPPANEDYELRIIFRSHYTRYRFRPSLGYRWQFHKNISATVETQLNFEYEAYDTRTPGTDVRVATTYNLNASTIPISSLTLNIHLR